LIDNAYGDTKFINLLNYIMQNFKLGTHNFWVLPVHDSFCLNDASVKKKSMKDNKN